MTPDALAVLHARCFSGAPRPWSAQEFADMLAEAGAFLVTGENGFALARVAADEAELLTIAMDPAARRRGGGARLLGECEEQVRAAGATRMLLEVAEDNEAAVGLYKGAGYLSAGFRKDYYRADGRKASALVMVKPL